MLFEHWPVDRDLAELQALKILEAPYKQSLSLVLQNCWLRVQETATLAVHL